MKKTFIVFIAFVALSSSLAPFTSIAQTQPAGQVVLSANNSGTSANSANCGDDAFSKYFCSVSSLPEMLNFAFQAAIRLGAVLAVLRIAYAGYLYMGSEDMWSTKSQAKEVFRDAIIGLLVLIAIWLILHQIDPRILNLNILQPSSAPTQTTSGFQSVNTVPTTPL